MPHGEALTTHDQEVGSLDKGSPSGPSQLLVPKTQEGPTEWWKGGEVREESNSG